MTGSDFHLVENYAFEGAENVVFLISISEEKHGRQRNRFH